MCVYAVVDLTIVHVPFLSLVHPWIVDMMFEVLLSLQTLYHYKMTVRYTSSLQTWKYHKFSLPVLTFF